MSDYVLICIAFNGKPQATRPADFITKPPVSLALARIPDLGRSCLQGRTPRLDATIIRDITRKTKTCRSATGQQARIIVSVSQSSGTVIFQNHASRRIAVNFRTCSVRAISVGSRSIELAP